MLIFSFAIDPRVLYLSAELKCGSSPYVLASVKAEPIFPSAALRAMLQSLIQVHHHVDSQLNTKMLNSLDNVCCCIHKLIHFFKSLLSIFHGSHSINDI